MFVFIFETTAEESFCLSFSSICLKFASLLFLKRGVQKRDLNRLSISTMNR